MGEELMGMELGIVVADVVFLVVVVVSAGVRAAVSGMEWRILFRGVVIVGTAGVLAVGLVVFVLSRAAALCLFKDLWIEGRQLAEIGPIALARRSRSRIPLVFVSALR